MLDVFSYTGGFSVYALAGGARTITALDLSEPALETLKINVENNGFDAELIDVMAGDAFASLMQLIESRRKFNMVIVDPPAFANSRASMRNAGWITGAWWRWRCACWRTTAYWDGACSSRITEVFFQLVERSA